MKLFDIALLLCLFSLSFTGLSAVALKPWLGEVLVVESQTIGIVEFYASIASNGGKIHQETCDGFFDLNASLAIDDTISFELDLFGGETSHSHFQFQSITLSGRKQFLNDIVNDPLSLSLGVSVSQVFNAGLHHLATPEFYHGGIECEMDVSLGKELSCQQFWTSRAWAVLGFGVADFGSPWLRANIDWEHNWWDIHAVHIFVHSLWGFGGNSINPSHFRGYGPIHHQCIDVGLGYLYTFQRGISVGVEYSYRAFARNCPMNVSIVTCDLLYSF